MDIQDLRKLAGQEQIDYQFLIPALSAYSRPRDKISSWLQSGKLLRVKKGLYVFGKGVTDIPYSLGDLSQSYLWAFRDLFDLCFIILWDNT